MADITEARTIVGMQQASVPLRPLGKKEIYAIFERGEKQRREGLYEDAWAAGREMRNQLHR